MRSARDDGALARNRPATATISAAWLHGTTQRRGRGSFGSTSVLFAEAMSKNKKVTIFQENAILSVICQNVEDIWHDGLTYIQFGGEKLGDLVFSSRLRLYHIY